MATILKMATNKAAREPVAPSRIAREAGKPAKITNREELLAAARALVPNLKARATLAEELRSVPDENVREAIESGIFEVLRPKRYGGPELSFKDSVQACTILAEGCANTAWVSFIYLTHTWLIAMLEEEGQAEVFNSPEPVIAFSIFNGAQATATPTPGGYRLSGRWSFGSGSLHANWGVVAAKVHREGAEKPEDRMLVIRREDCEVYHTWDSPGLRGTGSGEVAVTDVFVPEARTLDFHQLEGNAPGGALHEGTAYRLPVFACFALPGGLLAAGIARGAIAAYEQRLRTRVRSFTNERQLDDMLAHARLAEAVMDADSAELITNKVLDDFEAEVAAGRTISHEALARARMAAGYASRQARKALTSLAEACGASPLMTNGLIGRALRDVTMICSHHAVDYDGGTAEYGRARLGLPALHTF